MGEQQQLKFPGFPEKPEENYWQYPKIVNGWWHTLTGGEQKVLDYILRHTWGYQKNEDTISRKQFQEGIQKKDGEWADKGTGLSQSAITEALNGLEKKGFVIRSGRLGRKMVSKYTLRLSESGNHLCQKVATTMPESGNPHTINNSTINNIQYSVGKADKIEKEFNFNDYLKEIKNDKQRHIQIIGLYWEYKGFQFQNKQQAGAALKRELRPAKLLVGYSNEEITNTMDWLCDNTDFKWTLESTHKFIDENLGELEPIKNKKFNYV